MDTWDQSHLPVGPISSWAALCAPFVCRECPKSARGGAMLAAGINPIGNTNSNVTGFAAALAVTGRLQGRDYYEAPPLPDGFIK